MAKKSTRGKVRDRIDYSELLLEIKTNDTETFTEKEVMTDADGNSRKENHKAFLRMLSDEKTLYFYHTTKILYTKSIVIF